jgi:hypothetical protein
MKSRIPRYAVFTAVDGTLLDARTFEAGSARAMIETLHAEEIPVVPVSVMTLEELAPIAAGLGFTTMIIEAGGAIARASWDGWQVDRCGPPAVTMLDVVREVEDRSGANLLIDSARIDADVSCRTGCSEPFVIESGELASIDRAARDLGFSVRRARNVYHLCREHDRGEAFTRVRAELGCDVVIAAGSTMADADFLMRADLPIIVPGPDGVPDAELRRKIPTAHIAPAPAPEGWAAAIGEVLPRRRVRRVAS